MQPRPPRRGTAPRVAPRRGDARDARARARDVVPRGGRVCVFRALPGIGDLLCATPALRAIRVARPDVEISLVALPDAAPLTRRFTTLVDEIVEFPGFPGLPDRAADIHAVPGFLAGMQARQFDLAIQLHGTGTLTNEIVALFGARSSAGFHPSGVVPPDPARYLPWVEAEPEVRRWLRLVEHLGSPSVGEHLELPLAADADRQLDALLVDTGSADLVLGRPFVVVHPGASIPDRRWPPESFATVVRRLAADRPVVLTGSEAERPLTRLVARLAGARGQVVNLAGRTNLDTLGALVQRAGLLVSNDTGVSHIADAFGTPSVVVFNATDPARWAPLDRTRHRPIVNGSAGDVIDEALRLLQQRWPDAA